MKKAKKKSFDKKLKKYVRIAKVIGMTAVAVYSVYQFVPKNEKFDGVDGNILIESKSTLVE